MKPVLFVSHSSCDNALATRIVDAIVQRSRCRPIIDVHDLKEGTEWRGQLYQWMARCRAALILLTDDAIDSNWVLQEATILRARKALERGFRVFVAMPPDLRARKAERWRLFEPLQLDELQGFRGLDADAIADAVSEAIGFESRRHETGRRRPQSRRSRPRCEPLQLFQQRAHVAAIVGALIEGSARRPEYTAAPVGETPRS